MLEDQGYLNDKLNTAPADVLILPMTDDMGPAITLSTQLRTSGVRTQIYGEQKKFKQKMNYADKLGVPYVIFLGDDEIKQGKVSLKDMRSGEQELIPTGEAVGKIVSAMAPTTPRPPSWTKGSDAPL